LFADYGARWQKLLRRDGGQWGFRIVETLVWGPLERTMDAIVQRAGPAFAGIVSEMPTKLLCKLPPVPERERAARWLLGVCSRHGVTQGALEGVTHG